MKIKTIADVIKAHQAGKLPEGAVLRVDNDCASLRDKDGEQIAHVDDGPEALLIGALNQIGIEAEGV